MSSPIISEGTKKRSILAIATSVVFSIVWIVAALSDGDRDWTQKFVFLAIFSILPWLILWAFNTCASRKTRWVLTVASIILLSLLLFLAVDDELIEESLFTITFILFFFIAITASPWILTGIVLWIYRKFRPPTSKSGGVVTKAQPAEAQPAEAQSAEAQPSKIKLKLNKKGVQIVTGIALVFILFTIYTSNRNEAKIKADWESVKIDLDKYLINSELVESHYYETYDYRTPWYDYFGRYLNSSLDDAVVVELDSIVLIKNKNAQSFFDSTEIFLQTAMSQFQTLMDRNRTSIRYKVSGQGWNQGWVYDSDDIEELAADIFSKREAQREYRKNAHPAWKNLSFYEKKADVLKKLKYDSDIIIDDDDIFTTKIGTFKYVVSPRFHEGKLFKIIFFSKDYQLSVFDTKLKNDFMNLYNIISNKYGSVRILKAASWDIGTGKKITKSKWRHGKKRIALGIQSAKSQQYTIVLSMLDVDLSHQYEAKEDARKDALNKYIQTLEEDELEQESSDF
jgi:hypothetical protein